jgi:hypothetical protein
MDVVFVEASNWNEQFWLNSGGTRAKKILLDEENQHWFFKCSEKKDAKGDKPAKYYKYEFWSEVIAHQLGKAWGLDILRYDPAVFKDEIGCICKSMHRTGEQQLLEVGRFMTAINTNFIPDDRKTRDQYSFQLLSKTLDHFSLAKYWHFFFETLLFDTVIGNTDRHQENWAFIGHSSILSKRLDVMENDVKKLLTSYKFIKKLLGWIYDHKKQKLTPDFEQIRLQAINLERVAPVYDNGSSLARELNEDRIDQLLRNEHLLQKYIEGGLSELHWNNKKLSHFNLVGELLNSSYIEEVRKAGHFLTSFDLDKCQRIIQKIDDCVPENWNTYRLPQSRKDLICKLVTLRAEKLKSLLS